MKKLPFLVSILLILACNVANATSINLNTFTADSTVAVSLDGTSAVFNEDPNLFSVSLRQNTFAIPANATGISFTYALSVPENNEDYFHAYLADSSGFAVAGYDFITGGYNGNYAGTVSWDLTSSSLLGTSVGLIFDMSAGFDDWGYESTLILSSVDVASASTPVPEPGTITLLLAGFAGLGLMAIKKRNI